MSEIRVLEAITPSRIGGAEVFVTELYRSFSELGARVEVFCPAGRPFVDYAQKRGISPITWKTHGKIDPVTVLKLARIIKKHRIDVIHTHLSTASLLGAFAAKLAGKPSVAHVHGLNTATCFRYSTRVIAVSEAVKRHLVNQGISEEKIVVVHNGVDLLRFKPAPLREAKIKLRYDPDAPVFGVFGRLSEEKGQRTAIEAMFLLLKDHPDALLLVVGDGKNRADLETSVQALGISGNIRFIGFLEDVREHMSACDTVIVPSQIEGFGLSAVEAMALGKPVVASTAGGLSEIVVKGETGYLVPPNDPNAISDSLEKLIDNPSLAASMGMKGRGRVEEHFALGTQMQKVLEILRGMLPHFQSEEDQ